MRDLLKNNIPNQWFFCNPFNISSKNVIKKLSKKTGVIFFLDKNVEHKEFNKAIEPLVEICRTKRIIFFLQSSFFLASKFKATGIFMDHNRKIMSNMVSSNYVRSRFLLATKVHNIKEAVKFKKKSDIFFVSNVFKTNSYPNKKQMGVKNFIKLCIVLKKKLNYALGGVTEKNISLLKNKNFYGFGAIGYFNKKNGI